MSDYNKIITDAKLLIALWENTPTNVMRSNIRSCIENGADVNVKFLNNGNNTPLHIAVTKGDRELVNTLLQYGARGDIANDDGKTSIQLAKELSRSDIEEILLACEESTDKEDATPVVEDGVTSAAVSTYKKRPGTANVRGQLYETKLLTLIYLRASRCRLVTQFYMGTNVDEIGDMDDVCLRLKTINDDYVIFLQAKHKDNVEKGRVAIEDLWRPSSDFSLLKYFSSYKKIRNKFHPDSEDDLFRGRYEDVKRFYIMYTTVKDENRMYS
ncbi:hypothetical protein O3G_MSEX000539 [Manduca sexta]|nr:hypothetical protein O3G_MSEX000539 [Manduca sexta]